MSPSSTSSSRRGGIAFAVAVGVVILAELLLRTFAVPSRSPYYHPGVEERLAALAEVDQPIDVLFVGSSVVRTNISPLEFDRRAADGGRAVTSFNGGLSAMHLVPNALYVENLWMEETDPELVVHMTALQEVTADPSTMLSRFESSTIERHWLDDSWLAEVRLWLLENLSVARAAGTIPQALTDPGLFIANQSGFPIDERGFEARTGLLADKVEQLEPQEIAGGLTARDGYMVTASQFERARDAIARTVESVRATGANYVLVNMPEHPAKYDHPNGDSLYADYLAFLQSVAFELEVPFIDLTDGDWRTFDDDGWFSDYHHMTPTGAAATTSLLADRIAAVGLLDRSGG